MKDTNEGRNIRINIKNKNQFYIPTSLSERAPKKSPNIPITTAGKLKNPIPNAKAS